jgi:predicted 3-demethylubiquinone-9 3-methyltransferase (glyoxalase superfamily)
MSKPIYPCLWFNGNAEEAVEFYKTVFKNLKVFTSTKEVIKFKLGNNEFMLLNGGPHFKLNPSLSIFVYFDSLSELENVWGKLALGGDILMPLETYPWAEKYGWLQDPFGVSFQLILDKNYEPQKTMPSFLFTSGVKGKAEEAIQFYTQIFKDSSIKQKFHYPEEDKENAGKLMYSEFTLKGLDLVAMDDGNQSSDFSFNEAFSFVVECDTQEEIDFYWNAFTKEGKESRCGWLQDKYGVSWQIIPSILESLMKDPIKAPKVVEAFLKMNKFEIDKLLEI